MPARTNIYRTWIANRIAARDRTWPETLLLVAVAVIVGAGALPSFAGAASATTSTSRYISWMTGDTDADTGRAEALACTAARDEGRGVALIAFGRQVDGGTRSFDGADALYPYPHLAAVAAGYARGLARCGNGPWVLAVATSNYRLDDPAVGARVGAAWQTMVASIESVRGVDVVGGIDLEPGWGGAVAAQAWVDGYRGAGDIPLLANASADGCPQRGDRGGCANGWNVDMLAGMIWHTDGDVALPQIYRRDGAQARQWGVIARAGVRLGLPVSFAGAMTQVRACALVRNANCPQLSLPPDAARDQLAEAVGDQHPVPGSTDVGWG
jgi:hypothetical protein